MCWPPATQGWPLLSLVCVNSIVFAIQGWPLLVCVCKFDACHGLRGMVQQRGDFSCASSLTISDGLKSMVPEMNHRHKPDMQTLALIDVVATCNTGKYTRSICLLSCFVADSGQWRRQHLSSFKAGKSANSSPADSGWLGAETQTTSRAASDTFLLRSIVGRASEAAMPAGSRKVQSQVR